MASILDHCLHLPRTRLRKGEVVLRERERSDCLYVLTNGAIEVFRGDVTIVVIDGVGAVFGEMSVLLNLPHTASARAAADSSVCVIENARAFLHANPAVALPIARILAQRLLNATSYLVDLKHQFEDRADHLGLVDEVLEALSHEQSDSFVEPPPGP